MMRTKMLIDCDPGHDDAVAILYAAKHLELVGVTTCHGNNTIENVTRNALSVLTLGGVAAPLARGCGDPLIGRKALVANAHGTTGLDGTELPAPDRAPVAAHAVDFLIDMARTHRDELVLAVIGPATNVALAIKKEPRFASWLREITVMGGSTALGNITPVAEYNVWCDPEAAAEMFDCGAPIRMAGYNVTSVTGTNEADVARLLAGPNVARHIGELLDFYLRRQRDRLGFDIAPMHDVCAIVPYVKEGLIEYRRCHVGVELTGRLTRGMTVCDLRTLTPQGRADRGAGEPNALAAIRTEARRLIDHVVATLLSYP
jgi:inosine-uridine nucleoside N-ribohydrolase